ncbi:LRR domains-containing disease resistance protein [Quillaja saponaria]|uniref:LRR domains-containing disease resistance protein n=1 Tax=Quillaja saponaria TaxID=32244 RepID=A0AAD7VNY1_QUISA|nr:LRR domains-containing disease resistance protein [Quillaja saponaria]
MLAMDLLWGSFFQEIGKNEYGEYCKMHDLMHDLAVSVARKEGTIVNVKEKENIADQTRHVSIGFALDSVRDVPSSLLKANKLRTFLWPKDRYGPGIQIDKIVYDSLVSSFNCSRVLDLSHLCNERLSNSIGLLKHLRYLDLSWNDRIEVLPHSITRLVNLQTLNLTFCNRLRELPGDIIKLRNLGHLYLYCCNSLSHMPHGLGQLTSRGCPSKSKPSGGISELRDLNNLGGRLFIEGLEQLRCNTGEVMAANLRAKQLDFLSLGWKRVVSDSGGGADKDKMILDGLQPSQNIKRLDISGYGDLPLSSWVCSLSNLVTLKIISCQHLRHLPPLRLLHHVQLISLQNLRSLEYIDSNSSDEYHLRDSISSKFFPSLRDLDLINLPNLMGWWRTTGAETDQEHQQQCPLFLLSFPCLETLYIRSCPNLTSMPPYPSVEELTFNEVSDKLLRQWFMLPTPTTKPGSQASTSSSGSPVPGLRALQIGRMNTFEYFPVEVLHRLTSLDKLTLNDNPSLRSLSGVLKHLNALRYLKVESCEELDLLNGENGDYGMQWKQLRGLQDLILMDLPKLESLPEGLQHLTNLRRLVLMNCSHFTSFPEWIGNLEASLEEITIASCPSLRSLPEGMRHLKSLQKLKITNCLYLNERCQREEGADWPKIAHIPEVTDELDGQESTIPFHIRSGRRCLVVIPPK